ncbi:sensor histidine kinase [Streptomyces sp. NRRL S-118]|uniref:sensor histidine kinase n=1 Tax=Streptomyces sp. NRRL S-118 TaxID=1463881 RepID=UPI0006945CB7|nr:ATP-binding protein [Streptomyces sp. NRRL S-118]
MSQLRAPAARPDRREGGRHGRSGARPPSHGRPSPPAPSPDARIRPQLLRAAVLPSLVVALGGVAAVLLVLRSTGARPSPGLWAALTACAAFAVAAVAAAALGADRVATSVLDRCTALRRTAAGGQHELGAVVEQLRRGERPPARPGTPLPAGADELDLLAAELTRSHEAAVAAVVQASQLSSSVGNEQKVEVFVNLARRLQSLVHREIQLLDELENQVEDPELLKGLFHVDHLATRIRRHAENLAVLGGAISRRQWSNPVTMTEVLRSSIAEVEQYPRVKLVPPIDGTLRGHAVADVIHLLAELVENATLFSAPHTTVLLRAQLVTAGLAVEVEDRGLGMSVGEQNKMNALLADPDQVNVAHLLQDGRIGLFVVAALARRHGIAVRLQSNIYGGVQAVLVLPQGLLGPEPNRMPASDEQAAGDGATGGAIAPSAAAPVPAPVPPRPPTAAEITAAEPRHPDPVQRQPVPTPTAPPVLPHQQPSYMPEPAPLPVRDAHTGRPQLPKRRAQEHLVPQLRDMPAPRRHDEPTLHDPGLMAAFRRGIGLAESASAEQPPARPAHPEPVPAEPARPEPVHAEPVRAEPAPAPSPDHRAPRAYPDYRAYLEPQRHDEDLKE